MRFLHLSLVILFSYQARSALATAAEVCAEDSSKFCDGATRPRELFPCLMRHSAEIAPLCKIEVERMISVRRQAAMRSGGAVGGLSGLSSFGPPVPIISFETRYSPGANSPMNENKFGLSSPIYGDDQQSVALSLAFTQIHFGETLVLSGGQSVSTEFSRAEVGVQYRRQLAQKRSWGARASVGYAGDQISQASNDATYSLSGTYGFPGSGDGYWVALVFISNNSPLANYVPIPGIIYVYRTETLNAVFGFPIDSIQWTPFDLWTFSFSLFGATYGAEAAYGHSDRAQVFAAFHDSRQSFIPTARLSDRDRLTLHESRIGAGIRYPIIAGPQLEIEAGQAFNRSIYGGTSVFNQDLGKATIASDFYLSASFKLAF